MELKKINILSMAKITGLLGVIYGLISGILVSVVYSKSDAFASIGAAMPALISTLGYSSIIVLPILNGIIYFLAGVILAFVYNILAKKVGGINLEFADKKKK